MKIAVVILHYRNLPDTLECLDSLQRQDYNNFEVVLVDNASQDTDLENALAHYPRIHLLCNSENLGFAEGSNCGIRYALSRNSDAVLLLNNDTIADPCLLSTFAHASHHHPEAGVFGAKIYYYDEPNVIWHAGGDVDPQTLRCYHHGCPDSDLEKKWDAIREIAYACGCALFVTRSAIEKVGLMAPEFFLLWEEIDWCWRIRKAGYHCLYIPQAKVWHKISRSFEGGNRGPLWQYYYFRNRLLFLKRNFSQMEKLKFYLTQFPKDLCNILGPLLRSESSPGIKKLHLSAFKGIRDFFFSKVD